MEATTIGDSIALAEVGAADRGLTQPSLGEGGIGVRPGFEGESDLRGVIKNRHD